MCCYQQSKYWGQRAFRVTGSFSSGHLLAEHTAPIVSPTERVVGRPFEPAVESWLFFLHAFHFWWNTFLSCSSGFADMNLTCAGGSCKLGSKSER